MAKTISLSLGTFTLFWKDSLTRGQVRYYHFHHPHKVTSFKDIIELHGGTKFAKDPFPIVMLLSAKA